MYSLTSFKEIYALFLKEQPLGMHGLDDYSFFIYSSKRVTVWNLNHVSDLFSLTK